MKQLSEKITKYIIKTGAVSPELYVVYQYGFQIGLEMLCCFATCFGIAIYMHMIPEFVVFTGIFILLRTYAGGVHLNSFGACYICSVAVQTLVMYFNNKYKFTVSIAWVLILMSAILILKAAPVESINRELDNTEKEHCQKVTMKILMGVIAFAICCTVGLIQDMLSLIALTSFIILISQYVGILKYKIENSKNKRR